MNTSRARLLALIDERYTCKVDGKILTVVIRRGAGIKALSDFDTFSAEGDIHVIKLGGTISAAQQLQKPFAEAKDGDSILIYCPVSKRHEAALHVLRTGCPSLAAVA